MVSNIIGERRRPIWIASKSPLAGKNESLVWCVVDSCICLPHILTMASEGQNIHVGVFMCLGASRYMPQTEVQCGAMFLLKKTPVGLGLKVLLKCTNAIAPNKKYSFLELKGIYMYTMVKYPKYLSKCQ